MTFCFPLFTSVRPSADAAELASLRDFLNSWRSAGFERAALPTPEMPYVKQ
jgi:hypothetical protein